MDVMRIAAKGRRVMTPGLLLSIVLSAAVGCGICGCASFGDGKDPYAVEMPVAIENVAVPPGKPLNAAIFAAAARRKWIPQLQSDGTVRCTILQRGNVVVVDVVPTGERTFSIRHVQSSIPVRKYNQWADNLSREIVYRATLPE